MYSVMVAQLTADQIQTAIDSLPNGGLVMLGEGTFDIAETILIGSKIHLMGTGKATILRAIDGLDADILALADPQAEQITISDLAIDGNKDNNASGCGINLDTAGCQELYTVTDPHVIFRDLLVHHCASHGVWLHGDNSHPRGTNMVSVTVYNCDQNGFYIDASDSKMLNCEAGGNGQDGFNLYMSSGSSMLTNCKAFYSQQCGFRIFGRSSLMGCWAQDNYGNGFETVWKDVVFAGCVADANQGEDWYLGGTNIIQAGCYTFDRNAA